MRSRVVQMDTQKFTAARRGREVLQLNLFDDAVIEVDIRRVRPTRTGYFISGTPKGVEGGEVRLVVNGPVMVGTVIAPQGEFRIRSAGSGRHLIRQIDPAKEAFECEVAHPDAISPPARSIQPASSSVAPQFEGSVLQPLPTANEDMPTEDGSEIRVLIAYTPALRSEQGGVAGMNALIDLMIQSANQAFEESGIATRLVLAHSVMVDYVARRPGTDLSRLAMPNDGYMDEVHQLRNDYAADLVHLLTNVGLGGIEGIAGLMTRESLVSEQRAAFAVTANRQEQTFVHEIGHNLGMLHDRYSYGSRHPVAIFPYAFGYDNKRAFEPEAPRARRWGTLMSTRKRCIDAGISCSRLLRFSNPDQTHLGDPLGVVADSPSSGPDGPADARTTINKTARWAGSFRSQACRDFRVDLVTPIAPLDGGEITVQVNSAPGCLWQASSQADFMTISSPSPSAGTDIVSVEVAANHGGVERSGVLTVAGQEVTVRQLATSEGICGRTPAVVRAIAGTAGLGADAGCDQVNEEHLERISSLDLSSQGLTTLKDGDFEGLTGLTSLRLSNNRFKKLPRGVFSGLVNLGDLFLDGNQLEQLPESLFSGLDSLVELNLAYNHLSVLSEGLFAGLVELRDLSLARNQLIELPDGLFNGLSGLEFLSLQWNRLAELPDGLFAGLVGLQELQLSYNRLDDLPSVLFAGVSSLTRLSLQGNRLTEVPDRLFQGLSSLERLFLADNSLSQLSAGSFADLRNLQGLHLSYNRLITIPDGLFAGLSNLEVLELSRNQLQDLPGGAFAPLPDLRTILLNDNRLVELPEDLFKDLSKLQEINLERNSLSMLPGKLFSGLSELKFLRLGRNRVDPLPLPISLRIDEDSAIRATAPTGAPVSLVLPVTISSGGSLEGDAANLTISAGNLDSDAVAVERVAGAQEPVTVELGTFPALPRYHTGYFLHKVDSMPLRVLHSLLPGDVALTGLSVVGGVLDPPFSSQETSYRTYVANDVSTATVTAAASNARAKVAFLNAGDSVLEDADASATGHQVTLRAGENTIRVKVTSEDDTATRTYEIVAVRDGPANVCARTTQIRDAIVKASGTGACTDITETHLSRIRQLAVRNSNISFITSRDFAGLSGLESLDFRFNALESVSGDAFSGLSALQTLNLYGNRLSSLPAGVFSGLEKMVRLDIGENRLSSLPDDLFQGLNALRELGLGGNRLSTLPPGIFSGLSGLEVLELFGNRLGGLKADWFAGIETIQALDLSINQLTELPDDAFSRMLNLQKLNLRDNRLADLPAGVFSNLSGLQSLELHDNLLKSLPAGIFAGLSELRVLRLDENRLTGLPDGIFGGLPGFRTLRLERNWIDQLPIPVSLEKVGKSQFKAVLPAGAPFDIEITVGISNTGLLDGGADAVTIYAGDLESEAIRVSRVASSETAVAVDIAALPQLPEGHSGYFLEPDETLPRTILPGPMDPPPARVTGVLVTAGVEQLDVSWTAVPDADGYKVQWKSGDEDYDQSRQAALSGGDAAMHTITGLTAGTEYTVRVIAVMANADDGAPSSEVTGVPRASSPAQVTGVAVAVGLEQLDVSWTAIPDADGYRVEWKSGEEDFDDSRQAALSGGSTTGYTVMDLTPGTEYTVRVIAIREHAADGSPSDEVTGIPMATPPSQVTGVAGGDSRLSRSFRCRGTRSPMPMATGCGMRSGRWKSGADVQEYGRLPARNTGRFAGRRDDELYDH